jgi:hypothetical protein
MDQRERIGFCDAVQVTQYAWSEWDATFFLYVESEEHGYGGWIKQEYVEIPCSATATPSE